MIQTRLPAPTMKEEPNTSEGAQDHQTPHSSDQMELYETQYFGFTPKSFCDGIYNALLIYTRECLEGVQNRLQAEFGEVMSSERLDRASNHIFRKLMECYDRVFDKVERYMSLNIFHIPNHVVLPEDQIQEQAINVPQLELTVDADIKVLIEKIRTAHYVNACLEQEMVDIATVQSECDSLLKYLQSLENIVMETGVSDLNETLSFLTGKALQLTDVLDKAELLSPPVKKQKIEDDIDEMMARSSATTV